MLFLKVCTAPAVHSLSPNLIFSFYSLTPLCPTLFILVPDIIHHDLNLCHIFLIWLAVLCGFNYRFLSKKGNLDLVININYSCKILVQHIH